MARLTDERGWEYVVIEGERVYTDRLRDRPADSNGHKTAIDDTLPTAPDRPTLNAWEISNYETPDIASLPFLGRDGLIMAGGTNLLYSFPKVGKTEVLTALVADWVDAGRQVLYLTEEPFPNWKRRLTAHHCTDLRLRVHYAFGYDIGGSLQVLDAEDYDILVVDTIRYTIGYRESEGDKDVIRCVLPLFRAAEDKTVVCSFHARKMPGEGGRDISGHHALFAAFDRALQITPIEGKDTQRRVLATGRCMYDGDVSLVYDQVEAGMFRVLDGQTVTEPKSYELVCLEDGELFTSNRPQARYCSEACKQQAYRRRHNGATTVSEKKGVTFVTDPQGSVTNRNAFFDGEW